MESYSLKPLVLEIVGSLIGVAMLAIPLLLVLL